MLESKDFLLRLIKRMVQTFARMVGLIDQKKYAEALDEVDASIVELTELPDGILQQADASMLSYLLQLQDHPEKLVILARLYLIKARALRELGDPVSALRFVDLSARLIGNLNEAVLDKECGEILATVKDELTEL